MHLDLPKLVRKSELSRLLGVDSRRLLLKSLTPSAILVEAGREFELFDNNIFAAISVNAQQNPIEKRQPVL